MGIISIEQADRLYWLGRYVDRVYTTLRFFFKTYDKLIDGASYSYKEFCSSMDIPDIYSGKDDFRRSYPFNPENPDSIISNLNRAYDNAIELRDSIGSECLAYIQLAIYDMNKASRSKSPLIELMKVSDHILAFYGMTDDSIDDESIRNIIKAGKRIERVDLYARLGLDRASLKRAITRMIPRVENSGLSYDKEKLIAVEQLADAPEIDYYKIVEIVESIL